MKLIFLSFLISSGLFPQPQKDTIVIQDYTKIMFELEDNRASPISSLAKSTLTGFFINDIPRGKIRFCSSDETSIWVNGRLLDLFDGCRLIEPKELFNIAGTDTLFVSVYSKMGLKDLKCELVEFSELKAIEGPRKVPRQSMNSFADYTITSLLILVLFFGFIRTKNRPRISYLFRKSFSLKRGSYEFLNTSFLSGINIQLLLFFSGLLAYLLMLFEAVDVVSLKNTSYIGLIAVWLSITLFISMMVFIKWILVSALSGMFRFRGTSNFQLFDFINFNIILAVAFFFFTLIFFLLGDFTAIRSKLTINWFLTISIFSFILWYSFKFVNHSNRKKLLIISYLCATEIIPAVLIIGWVFKKL